MSWAACALSTACEENSEDKEGVVKQVTFNSGCIYLKSLLPFIIVNIKKLYFSVFN